MLINTTMIEWIEPFEERINAYNNIQARDTYESEPSLAILEYFLTRNYPKFVSSNKSPPSLLKFLPDIYKWMSF